MGCQNTKVKHEPGGEALPQILTFAESEESDHLHFAVRAILPSHAEEHDSVSQSSADESSSSSDESSSGDSSDNELQKRTRPRNVPFAVRAIFPSNAEESDSVSRSSSDESSSSSDESRSSSGNEWDRVAKPRSRKKSRARRVKKLNVIQTRILARKNSFQLRSRALEKAKCIDKDRQLKNTIKRLKRRNAKSLKLQQDRANVPSKRKRRNVDEITSQLKQQLTVLPSLLTEKNKPGRGNGETTTSDANISIQNADLSKLFRVEQIVKEFELNRCRSNSAESVEMMRQRQNSQRKVLKRKATNFFSIKTDQPEG